MPLDKDDFYTDTHGMTSGIQKPGHVAPHDMDRSGSKVRDVKLKRGGHGDHSSHGGNESK